ncbi:hypothetical protein SNEBB_005970 [Seison nebaliae]|nr:hypothetical protein SNEBB_005970 [Seison nebaliae]
MQPAGQFNPAMIPPTTQVIVQQPTVTPPQKASFHEFIDQFNSGLCECPNGRHCFCAYCCTCCFVMELMGRMGETCCSQWFCTHVGASYIRPMVRTQFSIRGSMSDDFCNTAMCGPCVLQQAANELDYRGYR